jgi:tetratricopeptide (TPR) repeat protein
MAGIALGLSATARPTVLLFAVALVIWCIKQAGSWRAGLSAWVKVCLAICLVVMPVAVRNYALGGEWGLTTSAVGMNFYVGNHPGATGIYAQVDFLSSAEPEQERIEFIREAQSRTKTKMTPAQASRYWFGQGLVYIAEQPLDYAALLLRKVYMFFNRVEAQNNLSFYFACDFVPLLHLALVGWWLLAPLALGYWLHAGPKRRLLLLDLYFACYLAACMLFFVSSEYRLPVVPILALYAGRLMDEVVMFFKQGRLLRFAPFAVLVILFALPINYADAFATRLTYRRVDYYNFGVLYERQGALVRAERMFRGALDIDAGFAPARVGLARVLAATGRLESRHVGDLESLTPLVEQALKWYGAAQYDRALPLFERGIEMDPGRSDLQNNLGLVYYKVGRLAEAEARFIKALELDPAYAKAHFNLGLVRVAQEDFEGADRAYARALELAPDYKQALYKRGELARGQEQRERALLYWEQLLVLLGEDANLAARIDSLRRKRK